MILSEVSFPDSEVVEPEGALRLESWRARASVLRLLPSSLKGPHEGSGLTGAGGWEFGAVALLVDTL